MTTPAYESLIMEGIKGLPVETLAEIADFIFFVRKRVLQPQEFREELDQLSIRADLAQLSRDECAHLEQEFADYDRLHPRD